MNEGYHSILQSDMHDDWVSQSGFAIPSLQTTTPKGVAKACTLNVNSININSMLMIEVTRAYFHENSYTC